MRWALWLPHLTALRELPGVGRGKWALRQSMEVSLSWGDSGVSPGDQDSWSSRDRGESCIEREAQISAERSAWSVSRVPIHTLLWGTSQEQWENHPRRWEDTVPALTLGMEFVPSSQIRKPTTHGVVSRALRKRAQEWGKLAPTEHCSRPDSQVLQANQRGPNCCQVTYTHTPSGRLIWI